MESTLGEVGVNTEDVTGKKKSRFKFLKVRLFGRLRKKETEGQMKQSQSAGDVTAQEGVRGEDDSEDDCVYPKGTLSSRALSHDSIFLADQIQSSQPTRVLSQENVHSKIKVLQSKLQQQNMRLAPFFILGRRMEDSGTTSEDDGLPCSPPEMSFQEVAMQKGVSKYPEVKKHHSWLSLAGTGSEEEEQGGFSQPSSRPLSPVPQLSNAESPSPAMDFSSPAQYIPILDNSAARHRMSIKPRNQRASTKGKKPNLHRPRSSSMNNLDQPLSEDEETQKNITPTHNYSYISDDSSKAGEALSPPSSPLLQEEPEKGTQLDGSTWNLLNSNTDVTRTCQHYTQTNTTSSVSSNEITSLLVSKHTREPLANDGKFTNTIKVNEDDQDCASSIPLSICTVDTSSDYNVIKERTGCSLAATITDPVQSSESIDVDVSKPAETIARLQPVPAPRIKKSTLSTINSSCTQILSAKPIEAEKDTALLTGLAESSKEDDKPVGAGSFRFNVASAKYRSKTVDENNFAQDEESYRNKAQAHNQNLAVQVEKVEDAKSTELCRNAPDKRSSLWRDMIFQNVSNAEKSQNTECLKCEQVEGSEDRRGLFGVKLRSTSLSLKYRSELPKKDAELKRHSLESHCILKEPVSSHVDAVSNDKKENVLINLASQSLDSQQDLTFEKDSDTDSSPDPSWRSLMQKKSRIHPSVSTIQSSQPAPPPPKSTSASAPQSTTTQQLSKPALHPRPHLPTTSKPQPINQSSQQVAPKAAPRAVERRAMSSQREDQSYVSRSAHRDDSMDIKGQSKLNTRNTQTELDQQPPSNSSQPTWMELAKRKSLAWSDKTLNSMNF